MNEHDESAQQPPRDEEVCSEEDLALLISEDRRLVRLGIDPDADPVEIMRLLDQKIAELEQRKSE